MSPVRSTAEILSSPPMGLRDNPTAPEAGSKFVSEDLFETLPAKSRTFAYIVFAGLSCQASPGLHSQSPLLLAKTDAIITSEAPS